jgi:hypothetical protein
VFKKVYLPICLLALMLGAPEGVWGDGGEDRVQGNMGDLARTVSSYFPHREGSILGVDGPRVRVDMGAKAGLVAGTLLEVYRKGQPFHHPDTGMELGRAEEAVGTIEVVSVRPGESEGLQTDPLPSIQTGDLARIPSTRIPIAITWVHFVDQAPEQTEPFLIGEFIAALSETQRFQVTRLPPRSGIEAASSGQNLYLLQLSVLQTDDTALVGFQMQNTKTGKSLASLVVQTEPASPSDSILEALQDRLRRQVQP